MKDIYFSVVMPVYNKEWFVEKSIRSVLEQTYKKFELIIIDDGSTDNSREVIESISDERIRYIYQENGGESRARNHGISLAKYEYVAFLDSDDIWLPDFLETMWKLINKKPHAAAFGCSYIHEPYREELIAQLKNMVKSEKVYDIHNYFDFVFSHEQSLTASTTVCNKKALEKAGLFPEGLKNWVDLDLWARMGLYYDIVFTERVCALYNDVPGSVSKVKTKLYAPTFDNYKCYMKDENVLLERKKSFWEYVARQKMYSAYQQYLLDHDGKKAIREILPFFKTKRNRKSYWSMIIQFIITPERFFKLNEVRKK